MARASLHAIIKNALGGAVIVLALTDAHGVEARDANRSIGHQPPAANIPNPYAPPQGTKPSDRAGDAYATGFAIGLGTALINKQREDEAKRQREQSTPRR